MYLRLEFRRTDRSQQGPLESDPLLFELYLHPFQDSNFTFSSMPLLEGGRSLAGFSYYPYEDCVEYRRGERRMFTAENIPRGADKKLIEGEVLRRLLEEVADDMPEEFRARIDWLLSTLQMRPLT